MTMGYLAIESSISNNFDTSCHIKCLDNFNASRQQEISCDLDNIYNIEYQAIPRVIKNSYLENHQLLEKTVFNWSLS